jgi:hypothetical protein
MVMIDTHCVALSATLSSKEVLASRFYVRLAIAGQAIAWAAVLYTDIRFVAPTVANDKPKQCIEDRWLNSIIMPGEQSQDRPFRIYWIAHAYDFIQPSVLALYHTKRFDELEKIDRRHQEATDTQDANWNQTGYSRLPNTAFSTWGGFFFYPMFLVLAVERHLSANEIHVGDFREWGQSFTIITCACATLHWIYVSLPLLKHPFICIRRGRWIPPRGPIFPTNIMRLIAIGARPSVVGENNYELLVPEGSRDDQDEFPENPVRLRVWPRHPPTTNYTPATTRRRY